MGPVISKLLFSSSVRTCKGQGSTTVKASKPTRLQNNGTIPTTTPRTQRNLQKKDVVVTVTPISPTNLQRKATTATTRPKPPTNIRKSGTVANRLARSRQRPYALGPQHQQRAQGPRKRGPRDRPSKTPTRISVRAEDITIMKVGAIVNAANKQLKKGGGVDGAIHKAAGPGLQEACDRLKGCATGDAKATKGFKIPAKYIIHAVGPQDGDPAKLASTYRASLNVARSIRVRSIAFPCISTGKYGFPRREASDIAVKTVINWLVNNPGVFNRVIFCALGENEQYYDDNVEKYLFL